MNLFSALAFFYRRKIEPGFKVDRKALVVDIGSGDKPFWRADVFVDKLSLGDNQRTSHAPTIHGIGKFVDSDASKMPFKDKAFDFSFCSHLLEHVEDPGKVIKEIIRVSKGGYLEVPNGILENIYPFESHLWFVYWDNKNLIFVRKSKKLHEVLVKNGKKYEKLLGKVNDPFIRIYWKNTINYKILDLIDKREYFKSLPAKSKNKSGINPYLLLVKALRKLFYKNKPFGKINS